MLDHAAKDGVDLARFATDESGRLRLLSFRVIARAAISVEATGSSTSCVRVPRLSTLDRVLDLRVRTGGA
jgi:hypothetical protein